MTAERDPAFDADARRLTAEMNEFHGRRFAPITVVFAVVVGLLVGGILALLALPDESLTTDATALQRAVIDANATAGDMQATIESLEADVAAKDAQLAQLQAQAAGDDAAASAAQDERQTALDDREAALNDREQVLGEREAAVASAEEGGSAGIALPSLDDLGNIDLPEISEEDARGAFDRLIDRLRDIIGVPDPQ